MSNQSISKRSVELPVHAVRGTGDAGVTCPLCLEGLELHQPDPQEPTLFVGICRSCLAWFFLARGGPRATVALELPAFELPLVAAAGQRRAALRPSAN